MQNKRIMVIGVGGTGSFVAEGLCRLLATKDTDIILVDHDRVEPHNLIRQQFFKGDVGKFKSQALAERLSRLYGRAIAYSVYPYMADLIHKDWGGGMHTLANEGLLISCVDNVETRREIAGSLHPGNWWLDAGNGYASGQVLIGNARSTGQMEWSFDEKEQTVHHLPLPSFQLPALLAPVSKPVVDDVDCAEAVIAEDQSPVINQAMAVLVLDFVNRFLQEELTWMGVYLDMDAGTLQTVPADPEVVARMLGVKVDTLVKPSSAKR